MIERTTVLTPDCRLEPYWWRATPHDPEKAGIIPASADVAIVGSGITGLVAAIHLARAGRSFAVPCLRCDASRARALATCDALET